MAAPCLFGPEAHGAVADVAVEFEFIPLPTRLLPLDLPCLPLFEPFLLPEEFFFSLLSPSPFVSPSPPMSSLEAYNTRGENTASVMLLLAEQLLLTAINPSGEKACTVRVPDERYAAARQVVKVTARSTLFECEYCIIILRPWFARGGADKGDGGCIGGRRRRFCWLARGPHILFPVAPVERLRRMRQPGRSEKRAQDMPGNNGSINARTWGWINGFIVVLVRLAAYGAVGIISALAWLLLLFTVFFLTHEKSFSLVLHRNVGFMVWVLFFVFALRPFLIIISPDP